jgi:soluble lytic murein transglycosylase
MRLPASLRRSATLLALVLCAAHLACASPEPVAAEPDLVLPRPADRLVALPDQVTDFALPFSDKILAALADRKFDLAETLVTGMDTSQATPRQKADRNFLLAWLRLKLGRKSTALLLLDSFVDTTAPEPYVSLVTAQLLEAAGRNDEAIARYRSIDLNDAVVGIKAQLALGSALTDAGHRDEARVLYSTLADRPDPSRGTSSALYRLALMEKEGSDAQAALLRRIWSHYPTSDEADEAARKLKSIESRAPKFRPTWRDASFRADALQEDRRYKEAVDLIKPLLPQIQAGSPDADVCRALFALGRAQHKLNRQADASDTLAPLGEKCQTADPERGAKALYLAGRAFERQKRWLEAANIYEQIPALFPSSTLADDGHAWAGVAWNEVGDLERARRNWQSQVDAFPDGDQAGEAWWRLAWSSYQSGFTAQAIEQATLGEATVPLDGSPVARWGLAYWHARWLLYPDATAPDRLTTDEDRRAEGIDKLVAFCTAHPGNVYTVLAASRLAALAPDRLAALPSPGWDQEAGPWQVRASFLDEPHPRNALTLARLGLFQEAWSEWNLVDQDEVQAGELGVFLEIVSRSGDWLRVHGVAHDWALAHPGESHGENRTRFLKLAHPLKYDAEVRAACKNYAYDFRIFHALVREESIFNADIVSFAGARGLSQLMPATARIVARWLKIPSPSRQRLFDPALNLQIGARYLSFLSDRYGGNPFLAVAAYNAGEGSVDRWLREKGNRPTDEFIEMIPFRETRGYVKRVLTTWQLYHVLYDGGSGYSAFPAFTDRAQPLAPAWSGHPAESAGADSAGNSESIEP